jgi:hypothetical protein
LMGLLLCVICFFSLTAFNILSLWSGSILVKSIWCPRGFCTWMGNLFSRFGKFSAMIFFLGLFCWIYYTSLWLAPLLQCPWFADLVFWWSHWVLTYSFHNSRVFCLRVLPVFFSIYFFFEPWDSVFHLFSSAGVAFHCIFYLT